VGMTTQPPRIPPTSPQSATVTGTLVMATRVARRGRILYRAAGPGSLTP